MHTLPAQKNVDLPIISKFREFMLDYGQINARAYATHHTPRRGLRDINQI